ncbi:hypothetical protein PFISCL1PPCAC_10552, partial [Pristionchus fissidentatus]
NSSYLNHEAKSLEMVDEFLKNLASSSSKNQDFSGNTGEFTTLDSLLNQMKSNTADSQKTGEQLGKQSDMYIREITKLEEDRENLRGKLGASKSLRSNLERKRDEEDAVVTTYIKEKNTVDETCIKAKHSDTSSSMSNEGYRGIEFL